MTEEEKIKTLYSADQAPEETLESDTMDETQEETQTAEETQKETATADETQGETAEKPRKKRRSFKEWWATHKPTTRRLIQLYSFLLYNAHIKGFITGDIFGGTSKGLCVPGLNCYSCPGAVGACPLGSLQNALANTQHTAPYYIIGIILLYGLIFGRTICGFLCPVGLFQDLIYKIRTPKLKKNRVTRVLSYFKYALLIILVIGVPLAFAFDLSAVVPGFCKYVCPAGTVEGAMMLLMHPSNDWIYAVLEVLFSWKTAVLIVVVTACVFIYRAFCRFICPLGAIYGLFNRFALLGIKVDRSKCTDCGKCISKCKMDIKRVGDHECINCGDCIDSCPTKAITWKGSKIFVSNTSEALAPAPAFEEPTVKLPTAETAECAVTVDEFNSTGETAQADEEVAAAEVKTAKPRKKHGKQFWFKLTAAILAAALFIGVFTYSNFFAGSGEAAPTATYELVVNNAQGKNGVTFIIGDRTKGIKTPKSGTGTKDDPYIIDSVDGIFDVTIDSGSDVYYRYTTSQKGEYTVDAQSDLSLRIFCVIAGKSYAVYDYQNDGDKFKLTLERPEGYGNAVGFKCYDFTLKGYNGVDTLTLSELQGKVTVVNFWYTSCGPCVIELREFERVRKQYSNLEMLAIHRSDKAASDGEVQPFIDNEGWDSWGIKFLQDTGSAAGSDIYKLLGGRTNAYPRTLILNAEGVITAVFDTSLTAAELKAAVEAAGAKATFS